MMKKFEKIKRIGHSQNKKMFENPGDEHIIKEKLDGANFRWTYNENSDPVFGSKNVEYKIDGEPDYEENVDSRFTSAIEYVRDKAEPGNMVADAKLDPRTYTFFGENMVKHSLEYEWGDIPQVVGFDIYDHAEERWLSTEESRELFELIGIPYAPVIDRVTTEEFKEMNEGENGYEIPESEWRDGKAEGVVIINESQREPDLNGFNYRAKMVTEEFKEKHKETSSANHDDEEPDGHEKLANKYATDGRIKKHIHKMRDDGYELGMSMMSPDDDPGLFMRVAKDIVEEEWEEIAESSWTIDFKEFRNVVASRCASKLKAHMQGEAL